ncbi:hypothetical protein [Microvirga zambiensis]|uniref:hypothetical protein n=1 Tax=Microvirga zambiensis TaxID=1402137 RepID=UPI00191FF37A|nr:hypothetical protein [Microvirga zambiensis]
MPDLNLDREHLAKAERDIAEGERRVTRQMILIEKLRHDGHDTVEAEHLLLTLETTLAEWQAHREEILRDLERHSALRSG